ncbi:acyl-CoA synthetase [Allostella humosa]|uniref:AMP-binding protein n=1 Tax=Stella humosa TaxID=94 RepID=UPI00113558E5|nr:AMP-binding protein [Stella humosa]BBK32678.1 acyl-CoA synthetase [Stella humosa]
MTAPPPTAPRPALLVDRLRRLAREQGERTAVVELGDGETESLRLTFAELDRRARAVGAALTAAGAAGRAVLIAIENGAAFVTAFVGCLYAGAAAVPLPAVASARTRERLAAVVAAAGPCAMIVERTGARSPAEGLDAAVAVIEIAALAEEDDTGWTPPASDPDRIAFVQYSSGSTAAPRGFAISHGALAANQAMMQAAIGHDPEWRSVSWLPPHHDMGLVGGILQPLSDGIMTVLLPTLRVIQKPVRWLRAISAWRGSVSTGPTFMYEACVSRVTAADREGLDLSSWRVACCGAEPVDAAVIDQFVGAYAPYGLSAATPYPCYGLAEATLFVTGGAGGSGVRTVTVDRAELGRGRVRHAADGVRLVACGVPWAGAAVRIVDPASGLEVPAGTVGDIRIAGPSLTAGLWRADGAPRPIAERLHGAGEAGFIQTGDLGFIDDGMLVPVTRRDDVIVIRGVNHHPEDIERTASEAAAPVPLLGAAAFAIGQSGRTGLGIALEIARAEARAADLPALARRVGDRVAAAHGLRPAAVIVLREGGLPRTTSGKVRRHRCRAGLDDGTWPAAATVLLDDRADLTPAPEPGNGRP